MQVYKTHSLSDFFEKTIDKHTHWVYNVITVKNRKIPNTRKVNIMTDINFEVIKKNGKSFMRMTAYGEVTDMKIWKVNSDKPYIKYAGMTFYLDEEMKKAL